MPGHVDDVVDAAHDVEVAVVVLVAGVTGQVETGVARQVRLPVAVVVVPERRQAAGRQRQFHDQGPDPAGGQFVPVLAEHPHVVARHGPRRRPRLDRQGAEADAVGGDRPPGLGLPPVVDDRHPEAVARPEQGVRIGPLPGEEERPEPRQVVPAQERAVRVLLLDRPQGGRGREEHVDPVLLDHAPERAGVGRADRLAFVEDGGRAAQQRAVDDVGMAHDPADVRGGPVHLAGADAVDVLHAPVQGDGVAAVVAHHPLGHAGGAGGVEDVERVGGGHRHAVGRFGAVARGAPVEVAAGGERRLGLRPLQDDRPLRLVRRKLDGGVEQRLVRHHPAALDAAGGRQDQLRPGVLDAGGQLLRRETAEDHRVDRADAGARQHADHRLGHHRHVDDHAVAGRHALRRERPGDARHLVAQLGEGEAADGPGDRAVVDERELLAASALDVAVEAVVAGVEHAAGEPAVERRVRVVAHRLPAPVPVQRFRGGGPEVPRIVPRAAVGLFVHGGHDPDPTARPSHGVRRTVPRGESGGATGAGSVRFCLSVGIACVRGRIGRRHGRRRLRGASHGVRRTGPRGEWTRRRTLPIVERRRGLAGAGAAAPSGASASSGCARTPGQRSSAAACAISGRPADAGAEEERRCGRRMPGVGVSC